MSMCTRKKVKDQAIHFTKWSNFRPCPLP